MDDQQWGQLDNVNLLGDLARPLAELALVITDRVLLEVELQTLLDTGLVGVLRQGESQHGEVAEGHRLVILEGAGDNCPEQKRFGPDQMSGQRGVSSVPFPF